MIVSRSLVNECINCGLRYMLAQPIEIDAMMLVYFIVQFTGLYSVIGFMENAKAFILDFSERDSSEEMSAVLAASVSE